MTQPFFADLGKNCNGLLSGGYFRNILKIDIKCKTDSDVTFGYGAVHNFTANSGTGSLEARYKFKEKNLTLAQKWNTSNILGSEVILEDYLTTHTKFSGELAMQPEKRLVTDERQYEVRSSTPIGGYESSRQISRVFINTSFRAKGAYKNDYGAANVEGELSSKGGPYLKCGCTIGQKQFTTGFGLTYDMNTSSFTESKIGCQLKPNADDDLAFCLWYDLNSSALITSGYYKQDNIEGGCTAQWSFSKSELSLVLGTKYKLNDETTLRTKIDEKAVFAFGFTHTLKKGFNVTLSAMMNCWRPSESFQLGGAFEIDL